MSFTPSGLHVVISEQFSIFFKGSSGEWVIITENHSEVDYFGEAEWNTHIVMFDSSVEKRKIKQFNIESYEAPVLELSE